MANEIKVGPYAQPTKGSPSKIEKTVDQFIVKGFADAIFGEENWDVALQSFMKTYDKLKEAQKIEAAFRICYWIDCISEMSKYIKPDLAVLKNVFKDDLKDVNKLIDEYEKEDKAAAKKSKKTAAPKKAKVKAKAKKK